MNRFGYRQLLLAGLLGAPAVTAVAKPAPAVPDQNLPDVLLIGDSITIGYTPTVQATLIFATTTPVPEKNNEKRRERDVVAYNAAAVKVVAKHGVVVNDLHAFVLPHQAEWQKPDNVHFNNSTEMGKAVAAAMAQALSRP